MDYTVFLPDIDVEDGKARVMNNLPLYFRLVKKFDGAKMAGDIVAAVGSGDSEEIANAAHALKGLAANLGFPVVKKIAAEIEQVSREGTGNLKLEASTASLEEVVASLVAAIERLLATQE
jgi:hypothetical protein